MKLAWGSDGGEVEDDASFLKMNLYFTSKFPWQFLIVQYANRSKSVISLNVQLQRSVPNGNMTN